MANVIKHKRGSGSDPSASDLVVGEVAIRTDTGKLFTKMDNGSVAEIAGGGSDIAINTLSSSSGTGGGSATFNGSAYRFTLSSPPSVSAQQLLVSINGVIQKPVAGTGQPSEGFSVDGNDIILGDAPATGADFFIVTFKSLGVSEPADNSVTSAKIVDGAIVNADINASAAIAGTKIAPDFGSQNIVTTGGLTIDTSTLHVDTSNNRVGIGTTSSTTRFTIVQSANNSTGGLSIFDSAASSSFRIFRTGAGAGSVVSFQDRGTDVINIKDQQVGIGTTSPTKLLTLNHATNPSIRFEDDGTKVVEINSEGSSTNIASFEGKALVFATSTSSSFSERMRIDTSGEVEIMQDKKLVFVYAGGSTHRASITADSADNLKFTTGSSDSRVMTIDGSGRVSIGINSASGLNTSSDDLVVGNYNVSTDRGITIGSNTNGSIRFADAASGSAGILEYNHTNDELTLASTTSIAFSCGGNVANMNNSYLWVNDNKTIAWGNDKDYRMHWNGTNLHIQNRGADTSRTIINKFGGGQSYIALASIDVDIYGILIRKAVNSEFFPCWFANTNGNQGEIRVNAGGGTSYVGSSDYRLKENISTITDGITRVKQLIPRRFNWKNDDTKKLWDGFIAHEVSSAVPSAVIGEKDAPIDADGNGYQGMEKAQLIPVLTAALQEAIAKIETLETKVAALEAG